MSGLGDASVLVREARLITAAELRPDARAVLYVTRISDPEADRDRSDLWVRRLDGDAGAERVSAAGESVAAARWAPDGERIAVASSDDGGARVAIVEPGSPDAEEVLRHTGPIAALDWAPAGDKLAVTVPLRDGRVASRAVVLEPSGVRRVMAPGYKYDGEGLRDGSTVQVLVVDLATKASRAISSEPTDHESPRWSPDGSWVAVTRRAGDPYRPDARLLPVSGGDEVELGPELAAVKALAWHPSSRSVAALATRRLADYDHPDIVLIDVPGGDVRTLVDSGEVDWTPGDQLAWADSGTLIALGMHAGAVHVHRIDVDDGSVERLELADAWRHSLSIAGDLAAWVEHRPLDRGEVVTLDLGSRRHRQVTTVNSSFREAAAGLRHERLDVRGDGGPVDTVVTAPAGATGAAVVIAHGGPADCWGWDCNELAVLLAARGLAVVRYNPRGSWGRGRAFQQAVQHDYGGGEYDDLLAVLAALGPEVDPARVGIFGHSHGGYMAAWALAKGDQFRAGVVEAPVFDLRSLWASSDAGPTWGDLAHGGPPWSDPDYFLERSPATHAHRVTAPTLILGAEGDQRCPLHQAEQMFTHLHAAGCDVELAIYPGADHETAHTPRLRADKLDRIASWFERHLGAAPG